MTNSATSLGWSNDYFQARKEGYKDSRVVQQPLIPLGTRVMLHFPMEPEGDGPAASADDGSGSSEFTEEEIEHLNQLVEDDKRTEIKDLLDQSPGLAAHIQDPTYRLLLTGPEDLRIGRIAKMIEKDFGTSIVVAKINGVERPYKDFSMEEIELLKELEFNDRIIAAMMNVTTEIRKEEEERARQEAARAEQRQLLERSGGQTAGTGAGQSTGSGGVAGGLKEEAGKAIGREVGKQVLDSLF